MTVEAERAVIADDGNEARLTLYRGDSATAWIKLPVVALVRLAADCSTAASRYLGRERAVPPRRRRGGDHHAALRVERDEALCELAWLAGADLSLDRLAEVVISKANRYRAAPSDARGTAERRALHRLASTQLPLPGKRHLRRIIGQAKKGLNGQTPPSRSTT